jgi:gliding motility-associated protein GldE
MVSNQDILSIFLVFSGLVNYILIIVLWFIFFDFWFDASKFSYFTIVFIKIATIAVPLFIFCEIAPKLIASRKASVYSRIASHILFVPFYILSPACKLLDLIRKNFEYHFIQKKNEISLAKLSSSIELRDETSSENKKILEGIATYGKTDTVEIMRPRVEVEAFDISLNFSEVLEKIKEHKHSRIPIYSGTFDNIKGILYVKDLLPHFHKKTFNWQSLIRPAYFIPESKKINDLLTDFQTKKIHMAIVIDEFGGTCGIITLEDVLEEIVGEIVDEVDTIDESYKKIDENNYIFEGRTLLNDFYKIFKINDDYFDEIQGDADTLAGIILELNEEIPNKGSVFSVKDFTFSIISSNKRRIKQIKVTKKIS